MSTVLLTAVPLLAAGGFVYNAIRHLFRDPQPKRPVKETEVDVVEARMDAALAAETHPGRRAALMYARSNHREGQ